MAYCRVGSACSPGSMGAIPLVPLGRAWRSALLRLALGWFTHTTCARLYPRPAPKASKFPHAKRLCSSALPGCAAAVGTMLIKEQTMSVEEQLNDIVNYSPLQRMRHS